MRRAPSHDGSLKWQLFGSVPRSRNASNLVLQTEVSGHHTIMRDQNDDPVTSETSDLEGPTENAHMGWSTSMHIAATTVESRLS